MSQQGRIGGRIKYFIPKYISIQIFTPEIYFLISKIHLENVDYILKKQVILKLFYDVELIRSLYANNSFTSLGAVVFLIVDTSVEVKHVCTVLHQDFQESSPLGKD